MNILATGGGNASTHAVINTTLYHGHLAGHMVHDEFDNFIYKHKDYIIMVTS